VAQSKSTGIIKHSDSYEVDKWYRKKRLHQRGFASFAEAEAWMVAGMERINQILSIDRRVARRFDEAAAHYLELFPNKRSLESEIYHLKAVMPFIGQLMLGQIYNDTLKPFILDRKAKGRKNKTINLSLGIVRRILNLAARDWRDENGMTWLAQAPLITLLPLTDARAPRPIMWSEQRRLLPALEPHMADMVLFALNTGARDDVICNLQWDWEIPVPQLGISVFVVPRAHVKGEEGTTDEGVIVCNSVAQAVIERQRGKHPTHVFVYRRERVTNKHVEPVMPYHPIARMSNSAWYSGRSAAGLGDLHVHDLRHTVGLRMREAGVPDRTQDDILWHSRATMTAHYSQAQIMEIYGALEKIKDEQNRFNVSLTSMMHEARLARQGKAAKVPQKSHAKKPVG
jgi:integrase